MRKQLLTLSILTALMSVSTGVMAEPDYCRCDCHKIKNQSNVIEIPATTKNMVQQTSTQKPVVVTPTQSTTANSVQTYTKTDPTTVQGGVTTAQKVHFGQNVSDERGNAIVNQIGRKLMQASGINKKIYFVYSTEKEVNAQTEINGTVTVFKGIMGCCENEDELAFVIGHEIGHADGYHGVKATVVNTGLSMGAQQASSILNNSISSRLNGFGLGGKTTWSDLAVSKTQELGEATYSKAHENDADLKAVDYMVKCGYNPLAGVSILSKIGVAYPDLFADHPSTDKRCQTVYNYVKQKYPQYISQGYDTQAYKDAYETYIKQ